MRIKTYFIEILENTIFEGLFITGFKAERELCRIGYRKSREVPVYQGSLSFFSLR
jgi:hypothetical protein